MVKIEPDLPPVQLRRCWYLFFSEGQPGFWRFFTRKGFRHVEAAAYFADEDRWVFIFPARRRMLIEVKRAEHAGPLFDDMVRRATVGVRFFGRDERAYMPIGAGCVGTMKALCGIRSRALLPSRLLADLLAQGAELVHGQPVLRAQDTDRGSGRREPAQAGAAAGGTRPDQGDAAAIAAGNLAA